MTGGHTEPCVTQPARSYIQAALWPRPPHAPARCSLVPGEPRTCQLRPLTFWAAGLWQVGEPLIAEVAFTTAEVHLGVLLRGHALLPRGKDFPTAPQPAGSWDAQARLAQPSLAQPSRVQVPPETVRQDRGSQDLTLTPLLGAGTWQARWQEGSRPWAPTGTPRDPWGRRTTAHLS